MNEATEQQRLGKEFENPEVSEELRKAGERLRICRRERLEMQKKEADAKTAIKVILLELHGEDPKNEIFETGFQVEVPGERALILPEMIEEMEIHTSKIEDRTE